MTTLKEQAIGRAEVYKLDPRTIHVEAGYNPSDRVFDSKNDAHDKQFKESIRIHGVTETLKVRVMETANILMPDGTIEVMNDVTVVRSGHMRLFAVRELISEGHNIISVPCASAKQHGTAADDSMDVFTSNLRKDLSMLGKAELFHRQLTVYGWPEEKLAEAAGITTKQLGNILLLAGASEEVKEMVETHVVSGTEAIAVIKAEGNEGATTMLREAKAVAKAAGKDKVTAKTVKQVRKADPTNPLSVLTPGLAQSLGMAPPEPEPEVKTTPRILNTPAKFQSMLEVLREILNVDDIKTVHTMVRDEMAAPAKAA